MRSFIPKLAALENHEHCHHSVITEWGQKCLHSHFVHVGAMCVNWEIMELGHVGFVELSIM